MSNNFIEAEEFLKQSDKVQKELLEWWEPQIGDLTTGRYEPIVCVQRKRDIEALKVYKGELYATPLLQMHQLISFIESKVSGIIKVIQWHPEDSDMSERGYSIDILNKNKYRVLYSYWNLGENLLLALWQVAIKVCGEEV